MVKMKMRIDEKKIRGMGKGEKEIEVERQKGEVGQNAKEPSWSSSCGDVYFKRFPLYD